jgi:radical SAM superfamily enzyme YgiQ (UPF0313 family)
MKTLLLNPQPERDIVISRDHMGGFGFEIKSTNMTPPLSLAYCAAVLEKLGHEVEILDAVALRLGPAKVIERVKSGNYALAAVSTATPSIADDLAIANAIKESSPKTFVVLLGPHVTVFSEEALKESRADAVVRGEPECTVGELAGLLAQGKLPEDILGLSIKSETGVKRSPERPLIADLDSLPFPARHLLPMDKYCSAVWGKKPFTTMLTSRGCHYGCIYCPYRIAQGTEWRARSPHNVVDEIEECVRRHGVREILFRDPLFTADKERALRICEMIIERGIKVDWRCETRADLATEDMIEAFARSGCKEINFGVESGSSEILKGVKRIPISEERIRGLFDKCRRVGIETMAFFIIGLPGETEATVEATVQLAIDLNPDVAQFTAATPYPNTLYYEQLKREGLYTQDWSLFTSRAPVVGTRDLSPDKLQNLISGAYRRFYFRPSYMLMRAKRLRHPHEIMRLSKGLWSALRYAGLSR